MRRAALRRAFSGGHARKAYDWRTDPARNPYYNHEMGYEGNEFTVQSVPLTGAPKPAHDFPFPRVDMNDPRLFLRGERGRVQWRNEVQAPYVNLEENLFHEADYESEDADFVTHSWKAQHYRRQGTFWLWAAVGASWPFLLWLDYLFNHFPDVDHWRRAVPPPLDFREATPDSDYLEFSTTNRYKQLLDAGEIDAIPFELVDGKKVYKRFAQVNQPMEAA